MPVHQRPSAAVCSTRDVSSIEVQMGPSGDFVRVADALPVPLTVYLGDGSDKFIGSGERDTCFPGGARRNRCVGGGNDDVCITGPRNSDCVGGPGDDYCRHGDGSDGCWGGPGNDVCVMGRPGRLPRRRGRRPALRRRPGRPALRRSAATTTVTAVQAGASRTSATPGPGARRDELQKKGAPCTGTPPFSESSRRNMKYPVLI